MILTKLVKADIYRDGGSYEAAFATDDGLGYGLWLPIASFEVRRYRWLFEYRGYERPPGIIPVVTGSDQEREIIERISEFLKHPVVDIMFAHRTPQSYYLNHLSNMLEFIIHREPCFPAQLRAAGFIQ